MNPKVRLIKRMLLQQKLKSKEHKDNLNQATQLRKLEIILKKIK